MHRFSHVLLPALLALFLLPMIACSPAGATIFADGFESSDGGPPPNILFIVMDDVGIDQMAAFGYGGLTPPPMPNIEAIAEAGVKFRNTWSMPECSPGRAAFFTGRFPLRTDMYQALGPNDLANSQISPFDLTVPKLLKKAGYESAMFGKFHLAGPEHNEAGNATPAVLGWDRFHGWVGGLPGSVDTTAGGVHEAGEWRCGFYPHHLAGACHFSDGACTSLPAPPVLGHDSSGMACMAQGGIFVREQDDCDAPLPDGVTLDFNRENAFYVSPLVIVDNGNVEEVPLSDPRARGYRTTIETDAAIQWINSRPGDAPWMATVSYSAAHTPWQPAPMALAPQSSALLSQFLPDAPGFSGNLLDCTSTVHGRIIQNQMTEAMDTEFGRLLLETGLATRDGDDNLVYDPQASNTVIVIVGDNGSLGFAVKAPFSPSLAKGGSYQTGVWVPLIVAGPQVEQPGRSVEHMVNAVDLFQFFGELAGLDAQQESPRTIDSVALLPYLQDPAQAGLRTINFTQAGVNLQTNDGRNGPCVMSRSAVAGGSCTQIPTSKSVCEDNLGVWWGPGYSDPSVVDNGGAGYAQCWQVNRAIFAADPAALPVEVLPESSLAIRDDDYKIVHNTTINYDSDTDDARQDLSIEFYRVDQAAPLPMLEDPASNNLLDGPLTIDQQAAYDHLAARLDELLASQPDCPGDGNRDGVVDSTDLFEWQRIADNWGLSSVYDFLIDGVFDGITDNDDGVIILSNYNTVCPPSHAVH
ncbi:sulfatase-like hydrolase/transferase [Xanthomonadaceae bacterium XH05]|nr:sulfatase-like hydrolase/transferase [Xanthomonadaceae bacterium XH05]